MADWRILPQLVWDEPLIYPRSAMEGRLPGDIPEQASIDRIEAAKAADVPRVYLNGFQVAGTNADVIVVGDNNGKPVLLLNLSFTVAKTLAEALTNTIAAVEEASGRSMLTTHQLDAAMRAQQ